MRKFIGYVLSWTLFWLGDLISKPLHYLNWWWLYPVYNRLMICSADVQDWSKANGPWESTK
jgi:hypothetical protein